MLRAKELLDAAAVGKLRPRRWNGPSPVAAVAVPNTCRLFKCCPTVNVDRLKPYYPRASRPPPPRPGTARIRQGRCWRSSSTARLSAAGPTTWCGGRAKPQASADDSWEPVEHLANCPERVGSAGYHGTAAYRRSRPSGRTSVPVWPARAGSRPARSAAPPAEAPPLTPRDGIWRPQARRA